MLNHKKIVLLIFLFASVNAFAQNIDIDLLKSINPTHPTSPVWKGTSYSVYPTSAVVVIGTLAYGYVQHDKTVQENGYELLVASAINVAATEWLKRVFNRTRPADAYPGEVFVSSPSSGKSLPSGHTSQAFALATTLTIQYKKWYVWVPAYTWATAIGYSRMYLGKHYPSDVLAGAVLGAGSSWLGHFISNKFFRTKKSTR